MIAIRRIHKGAFEFLTGAPEYRRDAAGEIERVRGQWSRDASEALDVSDEQKAQDWADDLDGTLTRFGDAPPTPLEPRPDPVVGARDREAKAARKAAEQAAEAADKDRRAEERVRERMASLAIAAREERRAAERKAKREAEAPSP